MKDRDRKFNRKVGGARSAAHRLGVSTVEYATMKANGYVRCSAGKHWIRPEDAARYGQDTFQCRAGTGCKQKGVSCDGLVRTLV